MIDHETLGRRLFLALLDAGSKRSKIKAARQQFLDGLSDEDRGRVEGVALALSMSTFAEAVKLNAAAAVNLHRAARVAVDKRYGGAGRG